MNKKLSLIKNKLLNKMNNLMRMKIVSTTMKTLMNIIVIIKKKKKI